MAGAEDEGQRRRAKSFNTSRQSSWDHPPIAMPARRFNGLPLCGTSRAADRPGQHITAPVNVLRLPADLARYWNTRAAAGQLPGRDLASKPVLRFP